MRHLTPDEMIDAAERALPSARQAHLDACDACRREVEELAGMMRTLASLQVPEPSPLFWDRFSDRVRDAVAAPPPAARPAARWFHLPTLVPLGLLGSLVLMVLAGLSSPRDPWSPTTSPVVHGEGPELAGEWVFGSEEEIEAQWLVLDELLAEADLHEVDQLAASAGAAEGVMLQLSLSEQEELLRLLQAELKVGS